jgi:hypothetical protein
MEAADLLAVEVGMLSTSEEQGRHSWPRRPVPSAGGQAGEPQGARLLRSSLLLLFFD